MSHPFSQRVAAERPPRGLAGGSHGAPLATARWATPAEIGAQAHQPGGIFLGASAMPTAEAAKALAAVEALRAQLAQDVAESPWREEQFARCASHTALLDATASIPIGIDDDRHMITVAGTRSGKGTSCIVPALCLTPGSALVIDPKGENARLTAPRRGAGSAHCQGMGQQVVILDPYNTTRRPLAERACWNPLDLLDPDDPEVIDKAASIAEAMMMRDGKEPHFDDSARAFVKGLIMFVVAVYPKGDPRRNLLTVHALLTLGLPQDGTEEDAPADPMMTLLSSMEKAEAFDGVIAGAAIALLDMGDKERGSVLSTARRNLEFLERRAIREAVQASSFNLDAIKTAPEGMTIYLCLPQQRLDDCGRWLRLMVTSTLERIYAIEEAPATGKPILFLLEEFASLGHMKAIETAAGYAAGFGVKMWLILQDFSQLKRHYKEGWETFLGNAGVIQAFGNSDATTLEYLSKKLGEIEVTQTLRNATTSLTASSNDPGEASRVQALLQNRGPMSILNPLPILFEDGGRGQSATTTSSASEQTQRGPMMRPDEIERFFRRESLRQLVLIKGQRPMILDRVNYHASTLFAGLYEPDPRFGPIKTWQQAWSARDMDIAREALATRQAIDQALQFTKAMREAIAAAKKKAGR